MLAAPMSALRTGPPSACAPTERSSGSFLTVLTPLCHTLSVPMTGKTPPGQEVLPEKDGRSGSGEGAGYDVGGSQNMGSQLEI